MAPREMTLVERARGEDQMSISPYGKARSTITDQPLSEDEVDKINRYFHASMYLCIGMLYLKTNPLLKEPLKKEHIKASSSGSLGFRRRSEFHLDSLQSSYQEVQA